MHFIHPPCMDIKYEFTQNLHCTYILIIQWQALLSYLCYCNESSKTGILTKGIME